MNRWFAEDPDLAALYTFAREAQVDLVVEGIFRIVDDPALEPDEKRVRADARKWYAAKLYPRQYGDRIQQDVTVLVDRAEEIKNARQRAAAGE